MFKWLICLSIIGACCNALPHIDDKNKEWPEFVCPGFGYWPGGICSIEFYECVQDMFGDWIAHHFNCGVGTVYDPSIMNCNHPGNVPECNDPKPTEEPPTTTEQPPKPTEAPIEPTDAPTPKPTTTESGNVTLPASVNCQHEGLNENPHQDCSSVYFDCQLSSNGHHWEETILHCDSGMVFNPRVGTCDLVDDTEGCGEVYCKKEGLNPDIGSPRDCGLYFHCSWSSWWGTWIITSCHCSHDLAFDPMLDVCTWAESVPGCHPSKAMQPTQQKDVCNAGLKI